jgi:exonuclease 3'-5' domain-containing protein 1
MVLVIGQDASKEDVGRFNALVEKAIGSFLKKSIVAFDLEGINLSRVGTVELVTLAFGECSDGEDSVFLVDVSTKNPQGRSERIAALKKLLESNKVKKIIHDCRMDCDALVHLHGIRVQNIHDTSIYHTPPMLT